VSRFRHSSGDTVHVAYCTNVHPAEDLPGVIEQLRRYAGPIREALGTPTLGVGLWLAAPLAASLRATADDLARLRATLRELNLEVVTLNGFPYQAFQAEVVKLEVYRPDWTTPERAGFTLDLAWVLAGLLPDDVTSGSISTLPFGWRAGWTDEHWRVARDRLREVSVGLDELAGETGREIRIALEPEPGCIVETTEQAVAALGGVDPGRFGMCLDTCHSAVQFEDPSEVLRRLAAGGVPIVKAQASAALAVAGTDRALLSEFDEPRFMHQVRTCVAGEVRGTDDLAPALAGGLPADGDWRVHFHVPVHLSDGHTTQPQLHTLLSAMFGGERPLTGHLELETYTWEVLPKMLRPHDRDTLVDGLARELAWLERELTTLGLEPVR
jgi:sugar phosphate isomerase/epimerase